MYQERECNILFYRTMLLTIDENEQNFPYGMDVRTVGMILSGFGIVEVDLSLKSCDPSQRANKFLPLASGVVITFAREILRLIVG